MVFTICHGFSTMGCVFVCYLNDIRVGFKMVKVMHVATNSREGLAFCVLGREFGAVGMAQRVLNDF
jgi:hypothetical protein